MAIIIQKEEIKEFCQFQLQKEKNTCIHEKPKTRKGIKLRKLQKTKCQKSETTKHAKWERKQKSPILYLENINKINSHEQIN